MMTLSDCFEPNTTEVAGEVVDGEAIIINLSTGVYYSMDKAAGSIWSLVEGRHSLAEIVEVLTRLYDVPAAQAQTDIERLMAELIAENLVAPVRDGGGARAELPPATSKAPYETPRLDIYRDMGVLLALDPPMPGLKDVPWQESEHVEH